MSRILAWGLAGLLLLGSAGGVCACQCREPGSPKLALQGATAVFAGTVTKIEAVQEGGVRVTLSVQRRWKGAAGKAAVVYTNRDQAACGYPFKRDEQYLVYARGEQTLQTDRCTRTRKLGDAKADLEKLGEPVKP